MKKTVRIIALFISAFMLLTFSACSAAPEMNQEGGDMGFENSPSKGDDYLEGTPNTAPMAPEDGMDNEAGSSEDEDQNTPGETAEEGTENAEPPTGSSTQDLITTPFVSTAENNFSTFSADVDTASYTYFRKLVNSGYDWHSLRNSGSAFRTEEFINYFKYDVATPGEGELFGVYTEMTPCPWNSGSMILRMTLQAPEAPASAGNNLVFLIDVSGSMSSADKLPLLKKAFSYLVGNLTPADTISIVTYSGREAVVLDGCCGGDTAAILNAINSLSASGSTNGEAGLTTAYQIAEKHMIEGGNNRIIMASDGDLNVGISSSSELKAYIEQKRDQGVYLSVLGFGTGNYRDDKMEALADNGNGVYYYIDGESEAEKVFGTDLMGTLYTVANDVKLQIEFNKELVKAYRLIGYDNRILDKEDFENDAKDAGEVGASHQVTVCYEVVFNPREEAVSDYMTLRVRYKAPGETLSKLNEYNIGGEALRDEATEETRFILSVVKTAALIRNRNYSGDITINTIAAELAELNPSKNEMVEFRELIEKLAK